MRCKSDAAAGVAITADQQNTEKHYLPDSGKNLKPVNPFMVHS